MSSYNTIVEADAYFSALFGYAKWDPLDDPTKQQALNSAQQQLDLLCTWDGSKTVSSQDNEFPRDGETEVPEEVKVSELEIAYAIVDANSTSTAGDDPLSKLVAGPVELEFKAGTNKGNPLVNGTVKILLSPLGSCDFNMKGGSTTQIPLYRG